MPERLHPRLGATHLDDLAIVILTTPPGSDPSALRPELDEEGRARLRTRLKLISRHDWPASMKEDPAIRRGYTLRQCFRLMAVLLLLDAHVPPSVAVPIARSNELLFLRMITPQLTVVQPEVASDQVAVVLLGDFWEWVDPAASAAAELCRVRTIERADLSTLWSNDHDLGSAGQRLPIDIAGVSRTMWRWIRSRNLMPDDALTELVAEIEALSAAPSYRAALERSKRR